MNTSLKSVLLTTLFIITSFACFYIPVKVTLNVCKPIQTSVNKNQTFTWTKSETISVNGVFSIKSPVYFELKQRDQIVRSTLDAPLPGEDGGTFWVRDLSMTGDWNIESYGYIFSQTQTPLTHACFKGLMSTYYFVAFLLGAALWISQFAVIEWMQKRNSNLS